MTTDPRSLIASSPYQRELEDPLAGAFPSWVDDGVMTYTPPSARSDSLWNSWTARRRFSQENSRFLAPTSAFYDASFEGSDDENQPLPGVVPFNGRENFEKTVDKPMRDMLARYGYTPESFNTAKNPTSYANHLQHALNVAESAQVMEDWDANHGWVANASMKTASAFGNYLSRDPTFVVPTVATLATGGGAAPILLGRIASVSTAARAVAAVGSAEKLGKAGALAWIAAGGAAQGAASTIYDSWSQQERNRTYGLDWKEYSLHDALDDGEKGALIGGGAGLLLGGAFMALFRGASKEGADEIRRMVQGEHSATSPDDLLKLSERDLVTKDFAEVLRSATGQVSGDPRGTKLRFLLDNRSVGMGIDEHTEYLRSLAEWIRSERPSITEIERATIGAMREEPVRRSASAVIDQTNAAIDAKLAPDNLAKIRLAKGLRARFSGKADFLLNEKVRDVLGFETWGEFESWFQLADKSDFARLRKIRGKDDAINAIIDAVDERVNNVRAKVNETFVPGQKIPGFDDIVPPEGLPVGEVTNRFTPKDQDLLYTASQRAKALGDRLSKWERLKGTFKFVGDEFNAKLAALRAEHVGALTEERVVLNRVRSRTIKDGGDQIANRVLREQIKGLEQKISKTTDLVERTNLKKTVDFLKKNAGFDQGRVSMSPGAIATKTGFRSKMEEFTALLSEIRNRGYEQDRLTKLVASGRDEVKPDLAKFSASTATLRSKYDTVRALIKKKHYIDPETLENVVVEPRSKPGPTPVMESPTAQLDRTFDAVVNSGPSAMVADGVSSLAKIGNMPLARFVSDMLHKTGLSLTGQAAVLFNRTYEGLVFLGQLLDANHLTFRDFSDRLGTNPIRSVEAIRRMPHSTLKRLVIDDIKKNAKHIKKEYTSFVAFGREVISTIRSGTKHSDDVVNQVAAGAKQWLRHYGDLGEYVGVITKTIDNYFPSVPRRGLISRQFTRFEETLQKVLVEKWTNTNELNRTVAMRLGWLEKKGDELVITAKGLERGFGEKMPSKATLSPEDLRLYNDELTKAMRDISVDARRKVTAGEVSDLDSEGELVIRSNSGNVVATKSRRFGDDVLTHPEMLEFFESDLGGVLQHYADHTALRIDVAHEIQKHFGPGVHLEDLINYAEAKALDYAKANGLKEHELAEGFNILRNKAAASLNKPQAVQSYSKYTKFVLSELAPNIAKAGVAAGFGMASIFTDLPRSIILFAHSPVDVGRGVADVLRTIFTKERAADALEDLGLSLHDHMVNHRMALTAGDQDLGQLAFTTMDRIKSPWQTALSVMRGAVEPTETVNNRFLDGINAGFKALYDTNITMGGLNAATQMSRGIAVRGSQRELIASLPKMRELAKSVKGLNNLPNSARVEAFKKLSDAAGLRWDIAAKMNKHGLLDPKFLDNFENALARSEQTGQLNFRLTELGRNMAEGEQAEWIKVSNRLADYLDYRIGEAVITPTAFTRNTEPQSWPWKMYDVLTSYSRSFYSKATYGTLAQTPFFPALMSIGVYTMGELVYRSLRDVVYGNKSMEQVIHEWEREPDRRLVRTMAGIPFLGVHTGLAVNMVDYISRSKGSLPDVWGNTITGSALNDLTKSIRSAYQTVITGDNKMDASDADPWLRLIPGYGTFWVQGALSASGMNPRQHRPQYR